MVGIPCIARRLEIDVIVTAAYQESEHTAALFCLYSYLIFLNCFPRESSSFVDVTGPSSVGEKVSLVGFERKWSWKSQNDFAL